MDTLLATVSPQDRELHKRHMMLLVVLGVCSFLCCAVLLGRRVRTGEGDYRFLVWNLILAWAPLVFATMAHWVYVAKGLVGRRTLLLGLLTLWLLFFPNAPYLVSDLKHLAYQRPEAPLWFDAVLVGSFVLTGVLTGFASLVLVHDMARRRFGAVGAWSIIAMASAASGFAIYLGRFIRLNSWDVLTRPQVFVTTVARQFTDDSLADRMMATSLIYAAFVGLGYLAIVTLTHVAAATAPVNANTRRSA